MNVLVKETAFPCWMAIRKRYFYYYYYYYYAYLLAAELGRCWRKTGGGGVYTGYAYSILFTAVYFKATNQLVPFREHVWLPLLLTIVSSTGAGRISKHPA